MERLLLEILDGAAWQYLRDTFVASRHSPVVAVRRQACLDYLSKTLVLSDGSAY